MQTHLSQHIYQPSPSTTHHLPQHHPTNISNMLIYIWITYIMPPKVIQPRANHLISQGSLHFSPTRDKGLSKSEKGINRRLRLGIGKRNPRLDHKYHRRHSPVIQETPELLTLSPGYPSHLAAHPTQEAWKGYWKTTVNAPGNSINHWAFLLYTAGVDASFTTPILSL